MKRLGTLLLFLALAAAPAFGQGCIMCYTSARAAATGGQKAMNRAVTILLIPPVSIMTLLVGFAFHYNRRRAAEIAHETSEIWQSQGCGEAQGRSQER